MHYSTTINIKGESFRLKEKRKAGMLAADRREDKDEPREWPFDEGAPTKEDKELETTASPSST